MMAPILLAILAAIAVPAPADSSYASTATTSSLFTQVRQLTEDHADASTTRTMRSDEAVESSEGRSLNDVANFARKSASKLANFPKTRFSSEMKTFRKYQVNENALETLQSPNMQKLMDFYSHLREVNPDTQNTLIAALTTTYGEDVMVSALAEAKRSGDMEVHEIAKWLWEQQINGWLNGVKSPDDLVKSLRLHEGHLSDKLEALEEFVTAHNEKNSGHVVLIDLLKSGPGGEGKQASLLVKGATGGNPTNAKTLKIEKLLLAKWESLNLSPEDIMDRLKLTETIEDMTSPKLATFMKYVAKGDAEDAMREKSLLHISTKKFGNKAVAVALVRATDDVFLKTYVKTLKTHILEGWLSDGISAKDVFELLDVGGQSR